MTEEEYLEFLKTAPPQDSSEFIQFLLDNNRVRFFSNHWLVVENKKYWTPENDWLTAFNIDNVLNIEQLEKRWGDREWKKKPIEKQTVPKRFHFHMYKK